MRGLCIAAYLRCLRASLNVIVEEKHKDIAKKTIEELKKA